MLEKRSRAPSIVARAAFASPSRCSARSIGVPGLRTSRDIEELDRLLSIFDDRLSQRP
ncbi:MAG: hypothetical protein ACOCG4_02355 [Methanoculleus sp.]|nr:hypothetical protein [Methanoculleus sp.]